MNKRHFKIGIAGTHSTGKSSFVSEVKRRLIQGGVCVAEVCNLATRARSVGFPILTEHNFESTLWIMAECMRQEAEASLRADVILVDRPVPDAFGYLMAALEVTGRSIPTRQLDELNTIAVAHMGDYDFLVVTELDHSIPLGQGRDKNTALREAAAKHIDVLVRKHAPQAVVMKSTNSQEVIRDAVDATFDFLRKTSSQI